MPSLSDIRAFVQTVMQQQLGRKRCIKSIYCMPFDYIPRECCSTSIQKLHSIYNETIADKDGHSRKSGGDTKRGIRGKYESHQFPLLCCSCVRGEHPFLICFRLLHRPLPYFVRYNQEQCMSGSLTIGIYSMRLTFHLEPWANLSELDVFVGCFHEDMVPIQ